jgi:hypothetical protein
MDATRRLPAEILAKILLESDDLPLEPINPEAKPYAPLAVSRFWRKTALETSSLWTTIVIAVNSETIDGVYQEREVPRSYVRRLKSREMRLEEWLQRSRAQLLSIELDFDPTVYYEKHAMREAIRAVTDSVMRRLLAVASRWRSVRLRGTHRSLFCIMSALPRAVCLTSLGLTYPENEYEDWYRMQFDRIYKHPLYIHGVQGNLEFTIPSLTEVHLTNIMDVSQTFPPFVALSVAHLSISQMLVRSSTVRALVHAFPRIAILTLERIGDIGEDAPYSLERGFDHLKNIIAHNLAFRSQYFLRAIVEKASELRKVALHLTDFDSPILTSLPTSIESLRLTVHGSSDVLDMLPSTIYRLEAIATLDLHWVPPGSFALDQRTTSVLEALTAREDGVMPIPHVKEIHLRQFPFYHPLLVSVVGKRFAHADQKGVDLQIKLMECLGFPDICARSFKEFEEKMLTSVKFNLPFPSGLDSPYN